MTSDIIISQYCQSLKPHKQISGHDFRAMACRIAEALVANGFKPGNRAVGIATNSVEVLAAALAVISAGGVWSSLSPDFGTIAAVERMATIKPEFVFAVSQYTYGDKQVDCAEKIIKISKSISLSPNRLIFLDNPPVHHRLVDFVDGFSGDDKTLTAIIDQADRSFNDPVFTLFSSGTSGRPKAIIHRHGILLQMAKEHQLHLNIQPKDKILYFTTIGWMMWNWSIGAMGSAARMVLYDGSPLINDSHILFDIARIENVTHLGLSPALLRRCNLLMSQPIKHLPTLRVIISSGSPLAPAEFFFIEKKIKNNIQIASISGGTDICGLFVSGNYGTPLYTGMIQGPALGLDVQIWDEQGQSVVGKKGELVCLNSHPGLPIGFVGDNDGTIYRKTYFSRFPGVWCQGDFGEICSAGRGWVILGRSDSTLNPGGVRIGAGELTNLVATLPEVVEAMAVGRPKPDGDEEIILFVVPSRQLLKKDEEMIKNKIRIELSHRHVPAIVVQCPKIPKTKNGKLLESAVRARLAGAKYSVGDAAQMAEVEMLCRALESRL